jgi:hypothetical protein
LFFSINICAAFSAKGCNAEEPTAVTEPEMLSDVDAAELLLLEDTADCSDDEELAALSEPDPHPAKTEDKLSTNATDKTIDFIIFFISN